MKTVNTLVETSVDDAPAREEQAASAASRREFLRSAVVGVSLASALPVVAMAKPTDAPRRSGPQDPWEQVLSKYGSEFGGTTRVG